MSAPEISDTDTDNYNDNEDIAQEETTSTVVIHAYDWKVRDASGDDDQVVIHCWGLDRESTPHLLRFTDFPAFCHVELPLFVRNRIYKWTQAAVSNFMTLLSNLLGDNAPTRYTFKMAKKTYYYRGDRKFPMLQLCFNNLRAMQRCSRLLENAFKTDDWGFIKCNVWEDSISIVRKLLTVRDVRYSQWFSVTAHKVEPELKVSTIEHEYLAEWDTMQAVPLEECKDWSTQPKVLAFDIECYSNNCRAMPDKYNSLHVAYMISCIYQRYRDTGSRRRYGIIIGDCNHIPQEKLSNCEIIRVNTEYEMIEAFARVVNDTDPEIITGYNILGFDYPYLDHRVKRWLKQWPCMGRISGEPSQMTSKTWQSGAYGHQSINILEMEGRISLDPLPMVRRDYKLDKYDLNTVCKKFIGKTKHDVTAPEMFLIYEDMRNTLTILVALLLSAQADPSLNNDPDFIKTRDQAQEAFESAKVETTRVMEYCIQDSELVIELIEKLNIWVGLVEMSNIVGTTIVELFTRGQQVRCVSQLYDLAARMGFILDIRDTPGFKFTGGSVYDPIPGLYDNIICLDFASLYPSIMMAYNICYTTLVPPDIEDSIPDEDCHTIEFDQDEVDDVEENLDDDEVFKEIGRKTKKKGKTVKRHYRFKFYKNQEGLLPRLVRQLVMERRGVNRQIFQIKDELKALEKTEDAIHALEGYLAGTIEVGDIKILGQRIKDLSESDPPASPEVITAAKRDLAVAQLFNLTGTQKRFDDALISKPPTHQSLIELARMDLEISQLYAVGDRDRISAKLAQLRESSQERLTRIDAIKLLIVVLDKRQLALKVSANSFFGFLGVHTGGKMPLIEGAMSITAKGRELIATVRKHIEDKYGGIQIYGDTDSVMVHLPHIKDAKECNYWGLRLAQEISGIKPNEKDCDDVHWPEGRPGLFPAPLAMEFEKAMRLLCLKKKKYAALLIGKDGTFKTEDITDKHGNVIGNRLMMLKKGIILARRDNCGYLRKTYTKILDLIMSKGSLDQAIDILVDSIQDLLEGRIPVEDLVSIRELGANYKSDSFFMKVFSDQLKKAGKIVNPGDRLDFVIVEDPTATLLGHKMRLYEQYIERSDSPNPEHIDYNYYIEKVLMNPINQLFEVGFKNEIAQLRHVHYRPTNRHKQIYLDRPVKIFLKMRERGYDINMFKQAVHYNIRKLHENQVGVSNTVGTPNTAGVRVPIPVAHIPENTNTSNNATLAVIRPLTLNILSSENNLQLQLPQSQITSANCKQIDVGPPIIPPNNIGSSQQTRVPAVPIQTRIPAVPIQTRIPAVPIQTRIPAVPIQTRIPEVPVQIETPVTSVQTVTPVTHLQIVTPVTHLQIGTPTTSVQTRTPTTPVQIRAPTIPIQTRTPTTPVQTRTPTTPVQIKAPATPTLTLPNIGIRGSPNNRSNINAINKQPNSPGDKSLPIRPLSLNIINSSAKLQTIESPNRRIPATPIMVGTNISLVNLTK